MVLATCTGAVAFQNSDPEPERDKSATAAVASAQETPRSNETVVSRSAERTPLKKPANRAQTQGSAQPQQAEAQAEKPEPVGHKFMTTDLNVRTGPSEEHEVVTVLEEGTRVPVTGEAEGAWAEIVYDEESHWVTAEYLADSKPEPTPTPEDAASDAAEVVEDVISEEPCPSGSSVESGLTQDAIRVHRSVCAQFPEVDSYGGVREGDDGEHGQGRALDIMISDSSLGDEIAEWVRANHQRLGASEVIWSQRIWTVERSSEGWRPMEDRGSDTANHYDHVHVTVYGDSGG